MTYLPSHFKETNPATLHALVRDYPLATWVVAHRGELLVNHIPFLLDGSRGEHGTLVGHVARANPVWQALQAAPVSGVAVFTGPQAYNISLGADTQQQDAALRRLLRAGQL